MKRSYALVTIQIALFALAFLARDTLAATKILPPLLYRDVSETDYVDITPAPDDLDYRLPNNTEPKHYDVTLTTNVHTGERAFTGTVKIDIYVVEKSSQIVLHGRQLTINNAVIKESDAELEYDLNFKNDATREFWTFEPIDESLVFEEDSNWTITINYNGTLRTDNGGFYLSSYTDKANEKRYLATTQFESTNARHGFPCYDEPAKRATFTITINHNESYNAISNTPVNVAESTATKTVFETTKSMSTYLIAFIVSDFEWTEGTLYNLTQRVYSRPETLGDQEFALVSGMLIAQRLADYYGIDFAFPKLDQVAVPDFAAGAMENWGLVTYREEYLLYDKNRSTINTQSNIANIIAHEYAHQWFGNLVAIKWWTYLWLKEGFATQFSYRATDDTYPEWDVYQMFHASDYQSALNNDASSSPRPMTHYVQTPSEISRLYDTVSYGKAGSVLHMWQHALTDAVFQQGLHNYLTINQFSAAEEWQLFEAIQIAAKESNYKLLFTIREMMSSWTQQGGYPLLTVERNYDNGQFTVTQSAFYNNDTIASDKLWFVPFNYAQGYTPDFRNTEATHYLSNNTSTILVNDSNLLDDEWLILNKKSTGYYRINYDVRNWNLIIEALLSKPYKIHPHNRAQLMHDAYYFSSSNRLQHSILLEMLSYLKNEDQYAPWSTANGIITVFNRYLSGDENYGNFKLFISDIVRNIYDKLGVNDISGEQHLQKYTRSIAINLACLAGIGSCLLETNSKLKAQINDGIDIEPNLQLQTYCNGLRQSGYVEFKYVLNRLMESDDQAHRRLLISALGCPQNAEQIKEFVECSTDKSNKLLTHERTTLLSSAYSRGEIGLLTSIEFLNNNWQAYANLSPGFGGANPLNSDIIGMSQYVVTDKQETKLLELIEKVKGSEQVSNTLEQSVNNNIQANKNWLARNRDPLMAWINNLRSGSSSLHASILSIMVCLLLLKVRLF